MVLGSLSTTEIDNNNHFVFYSDGFLMPRNINNALGGIFDRSLNACKMAMLIRFKMRHKFVCFEKYGNIVIDRRFLKKFTEL